MKNGLPKSKLNLNFKKIAPGAGYVQQDGGMDAKSQKIPESSVEFGLLKYQNGHEENGQVEMDYLQAPSTARNREQAQAESPYPASHPIK